MIVHLFGVLEPNSIKSNGPIVKIKWTKIK